MQIAVLGNEGSWYVDQLTVASHRRGHGCQRADFRRLMSRTGPQSAVFAEEDDLTRIDALIVRTMPPGSLEQVVYRMDVLHRLQSQGVTVLNSPRAVETAVDKFLTTAKLAATGLPTPRTIVCECSEQALTAFAELGGDVVVKPIFGSEGRGILRVSDPDLAHRTFRTLERLQAVLYLQEYIPHAGFDVRVLLLDGAPLGAVTRRNATDFRTNVARQGIAEPHEPTDGELEFARRAAQAVDACFAGIDLLYDPAGNPFVIEVNAVPGWRAFQKVTGVPVAERVIEYLERIRHESVR
ncbi:MAG: RimK family alpha-L-glutamate ligase [Planctomycetaceae bacterium]|nr:RimK family alpha-L-glutamate ligase [Planctomycetaceae bacterium]